MKLIQKSTPLYNRRIILIDEENNNPRINWKKLGTDLLINSTYTLIKYMRNKETYLNTSTGFGEIDYCYNNFQFPPQHPQKGIVYSCPDYQPDFYIPISNFHQFSLKLKESAFLEMCAHLGAKEIQLTEEIVDNIKIETNITSDNIPTNNGNLSANINSEYKNNQTNYNGVKFKFPKPINYNSNPYKSKWIETEPTWRSLQKFRLENNILEYSAELHYSDEMGINTKLAGKLNKIGLNIGGDFNKIKKIERKYKVIFWNMAE